MSVTEFLKAFPSWPMDHINGLIALGALGLASFAIYVVFSIVKEQRRK